MAQQLTILIQNDGKNLACAYYHWSGHTNEAIRLTSLAVNAYNHRLYNHPIGFDAYHQAIDILLATRAGLDPEARRNPEFERYPEAINGTKGVIFVSPHAVKYCLSHCLGSVTIDIGTERMHFSVYNEYSKSDLTDREWKKQLETVDETAITDIFDITDIPIAGFHHLREFINQHPAGVVIDNGMTMPFIYSWI